MKTTSPKPGSNGKASGTVDGGHAAVSLDARPPVPQYPDMVYLLDQELRAAHEKALRSPANHELRAYIERLTTTAVGGDWPETIELLEILASAVRQLRLDVMQDRKGREDSYRRWAQRLRAELGGEVKGEVRKALIDAEKTSAPALTLEAIAEKAGITMEQLYQAEVGDDHDDENGEKAHGVLDG